MHQVELWQQFLEQEALPWRNAKIRELHEYYTANRGEIREGLVPLFGALCENIKLQQARGELGDCSTIHVSLMRTRLSQGDPAYMLHASDRRRESEVPLSGFLYDAGWIYRFMNEWFEACELGRRRYMNRIDQAALDSWQAGQLYPFHVYMVHAVRHAMEPIRTLDSFEGIRKDGHFEVRVGNIWIMMSPNPCIVSTESRGVPSHVKAGWKADCRPNIFTSILPEWISNTEITRSWISITPDSRKRI